MKVKFLTLAFILLGVPGIALAKAPEISCFLTDNGDDSSFHETEVFNTSTAMIYLMCTSEDVEVGQKIKAVWIAADTNGAAPNNYQIGEKSFDVSKDVPEDEEWTVKYTLSKPNAGWPPGQYHVDLYVDSELNQSLKFQVKQTQ